MKKKLITRSEIGQQIKRLRERQGLTQDQLAEKVGVTGPFITMIERGNREPTIRVLAKIVKALDAYIILKLQ